VSPRAVPATRHQTTTKPAVQAEKTIYPETVGWSSILRISTKRNPGKNVQITPKIVDMKPYNKKK